MSMGIQNLMLALSVSLIIATGLVLGGVSISTGNNVVEDAREAGDNGFEQCMVSGGDNIRKVTSNMISAVLEGLRGDLIRDLLQTAYVLQEMVQYIKLFHPDQSTDPEFLDVILRPNAALKHRYYNLHSMSVLFDNHSPNSDELSKKYNGNWGSRLSFFNFDTLGTQPENGSVVQGVYESRAYYPDGPLIKSNVGIIGNTDPSGRLMHGPCNYSPDFNHEILGTCFFDANAMASGAIVDTRGRCFENIYKNDTTLPLDRAGSFSISPVSPMGLGVGLEVCVSFTHPEVVNRYPRQDNRYGFVSVATSTTHISELMKNANVMEDSVLYAVEINPWNGLVENILGCNVGSPIYMTKSGDWVTPQPFSLINHTTDGNVTGPLSPIARHGRHMLSFDPDGTYYRNISNVPAGRVTEWVDPDTEVLYWVRILLVDISPFKCYIALLVPRDTVMHEIDEAEVEIRLQIAQNKKDSDDEKERNYAIMYAVTAASAVILLALAVVLTFVIISPLKELMRNMANVAVMKTDTVDLDGPLSSLSEVREMQRSFRQMVRNLIEYKNYMPQSILVESDVESDHRDKEKLDLPRDQISGSSPSSNSTPSSIRDLVYQQVTELGLRQRSVTLVMFNTRGWHTQDRHRERDILALHSALIECLTGAVAGNSGLCDCFSGDRLMAYFNAARKNVEHQLSGVRAAVQAREKCIFPVSFSVVCGDAKVGNIGIIGMKKFSILSTLVPFGAALERYNASEPNARGLIDCRCYERASVYFDARAFNFLFYGKRFTKPEIAYEPTDERQVVSEEWMYQIDKAGASKFSNWNNAADLLSKGDFEKAEASLSDYLQEYEDLEDCFRTWHRACKEGILRPTTIL
eukprot:TRINITY_DN1471_c0_g2_i1.p1 TRINITY_DN1471_c0_g2~~TRINITY_DN1471_c0_g2_i1.p1  ORF type:complete len:860 (+),score=145.49 TRINITY_DN1471_c0_g2_i1:98-2677(+)